MDKHSQGRASAPQVLDMVVVGAGVSGLYSVYRAVQRGWSVRAFEAGTGVGGAWYWNRYPGCRVDIEGFEYSYSFSKELQQEWTWSERYPSQPEVERYLNHVCDRFDLRSRFTFRTRIEAAHFDDTSQTWILRTDSGETVCARTLVLATGIYSQPNRPQFAGLDDFQGKKLYSSRWPREPVDFTGQRVGLIGTGASGVQITPLVAKQAAHLSVLQRTAVYTVPLRNGPADPERTREIKADYEDTRHAQWVSDIGFTHLHSRPAPKVTQSALALTDEERLRIYEDRWASGGLSYYYTFTDLLTDPAANRTLEVFFKEKIRGRVSDPKIAELLTPRAEPVLTKRLAGDTGYLETMERPNVELVDLRAEPIRQFTQNGIVVGDREIPLDVIIFATGFDFGTGAFARIDIRGRGGRRLIDDWAQGVRTFLGMMTNGFPNLFWIAGPSCPFYNPMLNAQYQVAQIERFLDGRADADEPVEATAEAVAEWTTLHNSIGDMTLFMQGNNYFVGANVAGKPREIPLFLGGFQLYKERCDAAAQERSCFVSARRASAA